MKINKKLKFKKVVKKGDLELIGCKLIFLIIAAIIFFSIGIFCIGHALFNSAITETSYLEIRIMTYFMVIMIIAYIISVFATRKKKIYYEEIWKRLL